MWRHASRTPPHLTYTCPAIHTHIHTFIHSQGNKIITARRCAPSTQAYSYTHSHLHSASVGTSVTVDFISKAHTQQLWSVLARCPHTHKHTYTHIHSHKLDELHSQLPSQYTQYIWQYIHLRTKHLATYSQNKITIICTNNNSVRTAPRTVDITSRWWILFQYKNIQIEYYISLHTKCLNQF